MTQENPIVDDTAPLPKNGERGEGEHQLGQVLRDLGRATRRLPREGNGARIARYDAAQRERIALLMAALGDTRSPQHGSAVDELARIGDPAVPTLIDALTHSSSWLVAYRAAEALGQIGDGRASGALLQALNHPHSNVRWSAVRALAQIGDARALLALRRVARDDRGKTSWGEGVASAAQGALEQMQTQNMLLRGADLVKTALACVLMIVALIVAFSTVGELRETWREFGEQVAVADAGVVRRVLPTAEATSATEATSAPAEATLVATEAPLAPVASNVITGTAQLTANVRQGPEQASLGIGQIAAGDQVVVTGVSEDGLWLRVRLSDNPQQGSRIDGDEGWVFRALISSLGQEPEVVTGQ